MRAYQIYNTAFSFWFYEQPNKKKKKKREDILSVCVQNVANI